MIRYFWWNKYFLRKEHKNNGTFLLFRAGLFWPKRVGCLMSVSHEWCLSLPAFLLLSSSSVQLYVHEVVLYSLYEILLLRWHQWGHRDCSAVPGCHVCQEEEASVPATSSCFPKATFHPCSPCTSKFQCWDLGNKQDIHASKFYWFIFLAYWLKVIKFFNKMILCKIF